MLIEQRIVVWLEDKPRLAASGVCRGELGERFRGNDIPLPIIHKCQIFWHNGNGDLGMGFSDHIALLCNVLGVS